MKCIDVLLSSTPKKLILVKQFLFFRGMIWYWGETSPVLKLRTKYTFLACVGLGPKLSPKQALGDYLGILFPAASLFCSAKTGHAKVWLCAILAPIWIELKSSSRDEPSSSVGRMLCSSAAFLRAYDHRAVCTAAGQRWRVCKICFQALLERSWIERLAIPFWMGIDPAKRESLAALLTCLTKSIVWKITIIAMVMFYCNAVFSSVLLECIFCFYCFAWG